MIDKNKAATDEQVVLYKRKLEPFRILIGNTASYRTNTLFNSESLSLIARIEADQDEIADKNKEIMFLKQAQFGFKTEIERLRKLCEEGANAVDDHVAANWHVKDKLIAASKGTV